jgi:hypothetical protein
MLQQLSTPRIVDMKQISEIEETPFKKHVVFKFLSRSLLYKRLGTGGLTPPPPTPPQPSPSFLVDPGYFI